MLVDAHCHAHAFSDGELRRFSEIRIIAVSEDLESSRRTINLSRRFNNITPFIGIHHGILSLCRRRKLKRYLDFLG